MLSETEKNELRRMSTQISEMIEDMELARSLSPNGKGLFSAEPKREADPFDVSAQEEQKGEVLSNPERQGRLNFSEENAGRRAAVKRSPIKSGLA